MSYNAPIEGEGHRAVARAARVLRRTSAAEFSGGDKEALIRAAAAETLAWLRKNSESYDADRALVKKPWYPKPSASEDPFILVRRKKVGFDRVYEHGMNRFMTELVGSRILPKLTDQEWDLLLKSSTVTVLVELTGLAIVDPGSFRTLNQLRALYGSSDNTSRRYVRAKLEPLDRLGLVEMNEYDDGYKIRSGPLALIFFRDVLTPTYNETVEAPR